MSLPSRLAGGVARVLAALVPLSCAAQTAATNGTPDFKLTTTRHELDGIGHYFRAVAKVGTNQFAFIVPKGYLIRVDEPNRQLRAVEREDKCAITVRFLETSTNGVDKATGSLKPEVFRELLLQRYPTGRITQESSLSAGGRDGPAFDFTWKNEGGFSLQNRVAYIPTPAGVVEFNLLTSAADKEEFTYALNSLMLTFRFSDKGKIELPELLDKL
ncbi:MAG: hypothetical protein HZA92_12735 [Verrucomicrobia bacterium]|nr:hypothetical protein [Verrucomicrobiota bacterium]